MLSAIDGVAQSGVSAFGSSNTHTATKQGSDARTILVTITSQDGNVLDEKEASVAACMAAECTTNAPCFPGDALVTLDNGNKKKMADLAVGDKVLTHNGVYTEVFMFSHRLEEASYNFIELKTATTTLAITPNHYLYVNGNLREAQYVSAGDSLTLASGKQDKVLSVGRVQKDGIFNPHTLQGDIVVDGVLTSTYTSAFSPTLAHVVLAPLRGLYQMGVDIFKLDIGNALDQLPAWWTAMYAA